ncbi:MAG: shikimate dehydrogenase [Chloroflexota bacterium]
MRVGLIGYPVAHSISPFFQQVAFDALGIDATYELWETPADRLAEVVASLRRPGSLGANVTIPHKLAVLALLDWVEPTARAIGAVNTIARDPDGRLLGYNTDAEGFARSIERDAQTELKDGRVVMLGSGGAARAVAAAVISHRASELIIAARHPERAEALLSELTQGGLADSATSTRVVPLDNRDRALERTIRECDLLVNATPVGMVRHPARRDDAAEASARPEPPASLLVAPDWLSSRTLVCDLVYNPPVTPLLRIARERGARTLNGLPMLVYQGAAAFERWTGRAAPADLMRRKALEALDG